MDVVRRNYFYDITFSLSHLFDSLAAAAATTPTFSWCVSTKCETKTKQQSVEFGS